MAMHEGAGRDGAAGVEDEIHAVGVTERLEILAENAAYEADEEGYVTLGWMLEQLHERAFGVFLLVLALPCSIPFLYGVPQVVALPMLFVAGQMAIGRRFPWLPERLTSRRVKAESLADLVRRGRPYIGFFERLSRPRLIFVTRRPFEQIVGLFLFFFSCSILLPLPSTNTVPGIAVAVASLGLLQRDGLLTLLGIVIGTAWIALLLLAAFFGLAAVSELFSSGAA